MLTAEAVAGGKGRTPRENAPPPPLALGVPFPPPALPSPVAPPTPPLHVDRYTCATMTWP